jgi:hypothetical protein
MTKLVVGVVVFVVLLGIVVGLYATGPKYKVYCASGYTLSHVLGQGTICQNRYASRPNRPSQTLTLIRRTSAWERVWYALVGSKNTRD